MNSELKARIAKDGLFKTTRLMQLEKRAAMPPSSTFYHPRRTSGVSWIAQIEPPVVPEKIEPILKPLAVATIDSDLEDEEPVPLEPEVGFVPVIEAGVDEPDDPIGDDPDLDELDERAATYGEQYAE